MNGRIICRCGNFRATALALAITFFAAAIGIIWFCFVRKYEEGESQRSFLSEQISELGGQATSQDGAGYSVYLPEPTNSKMARLARLFRYPKYAIISLELGRGGTRSDLSDIGLANVRSMRELFSLKLRDGGVSTTGLSSLRGITSREELVIDSEGVTDDGFKEIGAINGLKALNVVSNQITDRGVAEVSQLRQLEMLWLRGRGLTDNGLAALKVLGNLRDLGYMDARFQRDGLKYLSRLPHLAKLQLDDSQLDSAAIGALPVLPNLRELSLRGTQVDDSSMRAIAQLTALRFLDLSGTRWTAGGIAKLRSAMPELDVLFSGPEIHVQPATSGSEKASVKAGKK